MQTCRMFADAKSSASITAEPALVLEGKVRLKTGSSWRQGKWELYEKLGFGGGYLRVLLSEGGKQYAYSFKLSEASNVACRAPSGVQYMLSFKTNSTVTVAEIKAEKGASIYSLHKFIKEHTENRFTGSKSSSVKTVPVTTMRKDCSRREERPTSNTEAIRANAVVSSKEVLTDNVPSRSTPINCAAVDKENIGRSFSPSPRNNSKTRSPLGSKGIPSQMFYGGPQQPPPFKKCFQTDSNSSCRKRPCATPFSVNVQKKPRVVGTVRDVSWNERRSQFTPPKSSLQGFANLGNTCYMNAILQALFAMEPFAKELLRLDQILKEFSLVESHSLLNSLVQLLNSKTDNTKKSLLNAVKSSISNSAQRFSGYAQHDAHEFFCQVLDQLKEEIVCVAEKCKSSVNPDKPVYSPVRNNFEFTVCHEIKCQNCHNVIKREETFHDLALDLPIHKIDGDENKLVLPLQKLLDLSFESEIVEYRCENCSGQSSVITHKFTKLPRILVVYLKRYSYNAVLESGTKVADDIDIPKYLTLYKLCNSDTKRSLELSCSTKKLKVPNTTSGQWSRKPGKASTPSRWNTSQKHLENTETAADKAPVKKNLFPSEKSFYEDEIGVKNRVVGDEYNFGIKPIAEDSWDDTDFQKALELSKQANTVKEQHYEEQLNEAIQLSLQEGQLFTNITADEREKLFEEDTRKALEASMAESSPGEMNTDVSSWSPAAEPMEVDNVVCGLLARESVNRKQRAESHDTSGSIEIVEESKVASDLVFFPVDSAWQVKMCHKFSLQLQRIVFESTRSRPLHAAQKPRKKVRIDPDGNCLFGSLSYWLTGGVKSTTVVRKRIVAFMRYYVEAFARFEGVPVDVLNGRLNEMDTDGIWGTHLELFAAASLFQTSIYVFSPLGQGGDLCWQKFRVLFDYDKAPSAEREKCIYLANEYYHFEPVLKISDGQFEADCDVFDLSAREMSTIEEKEEEREAAENGELEDLPCSFRLCSVVSHIGTSTTTGHYLCDVREFNGDKWKKCDDSHIESTTEHSVRKSRAKTGYMFFYVVKNACDEGGD